MMRWRRTTATAACAVLFLGGCSSSGGSDDTSTRPAAPTTQAAVPALPQVISTAHLACRFEAILGIQYLIAQSSTGTASQTLDATLQITRPDGAKDLHTVIVRGLAADEKALKAGNAGGAVDIVQRTVSEQCTTLRNPILTKAQLGALAKIVSPDPTTVIGRVRVFGPDG